MRKEWGEMTDIDGNTYLWVKSLSSWNKECLFIKGEMFFYPASWKHNGIVILKADKHQKSRGACLAQSAEWDSLSVS